MDCKNCDNKLPNDAKFCSRCGSVVSRETTEVVEKVKTKTARGVRIILGIFLGLVVFAIFGVVFSKTLVFIVAIIGAGFSERVYYDLEATANILSLFGALYFANKVYRRMVGRKVDQNVPPKKWYQREFM